MPNAWRENQFLTEVYSLCDNPKKEGGNGDVKRI
jgi:hypothetical protein